MIHEKFNKNYLQINVTKLKTKQNLINNILFVKYVFNKI